MEMFKETSEKKKAEFGIRLLTYLHPLDTAAFASQSGYSPPTTTTTRRTEGTNTLHYEMMMLIFWWSIHVWLSWAMCLDTFSSIPSKDGPIVSKAKGAVPRLRAVSCQKKKRRSKKKQKQGHYTTAWERRKRWRWRWRGRCIKKLFVQAHLAPPPPQG